MGDSIICLVLCCEILYFSWVPFGNIYMCIYIYIFVFYLACSPSDLLGYHGNNTCLWSGCDDLPKNKLNRADFWLMITRSIFFPPLIQYILQLLDLFSHSVDGVAWLVACIVVFGLSDKSLCLSTLHDETNHHRITPR